MEKILLLLIILFIMGIIFALPIYIAINFLLFVFHSTIHITLLQSFAIALILSLISSIFKK